MVFTTFSRVFGFLTKVPRYETKRLVGVWEMVTGIGIYALQMTVAADERKERNADGDMITIHQVEDTLELAGCAGFMVAALADHIDPNTTYVGLAVWGTCFAAALALGLAGVSLWGKKVCKC